jgi:hypothetical protein
MSFIYPHKEQARNKPKNILVFAPRGPQVEVWESRGIRRSGLRVQTAQKGLDRAALAAFYQS